MVERNISVWENSFSNTFLYFVFSSQTWNISFFFFLFFPSTRAHKNVLFSFCGFSISFYINNIFDSMCSQINYLEIVFSCSSMRSLFVNTERGHRSDCLWEEKNQNKGNLCAKSNDEMFKIISVFKGFWSAMTSQESTFLGYLFLTMNGKQNEIKRKLKLNRFVFSWSLNFHNNQ